VTGVGFMVSYGVNRPTVGSWSSACGGEKDNPEDSVDQADESNGIRRSTGIDRITRFLWKRWLDRWTWAGLWGRGVGRPDTKKAHQKLV